MNPPPPRMNWLQYHIFELLRIQFIRDAILLERSFSVEDISSQGTSLSATYQVQ